MVVRAVCLIALIWIFLPISTTAVVADEAVPLIASADPEDGKRLFLRCKACHTINKGGRHRLGPNLWDVVDRKVSGAKGFKYSSAFRKLEGNWDYAALDALIENPRKFASGTRMAFPGLRNPAQRAAVIAYLRTLSDSPAPLPKTTAAPAATAAVPAAKEAKEDFGGLPPGAGREETHAICGACHSLRLVTQQGLDADRWDGLMDWMTEKQGMAELEKAERRRIVAYLAEHFGPNRRMRQRTDPMRPPMPAMPMMAPPTMAPAMPPRP
ncbi:MAG TPA: c-type cytochrome [Thermohalobaculum sp.]|nr:c-type cytochrome [Thermohalobaculum sp.]